MKRSSSSAALVAARARFADTSAAEARPAIKVRRLGSGDETPNAEQSSASQAEIVREFSMFGALPTTQNPLTRFPPAPAALVCRWRRCSRK